MAEEYMYKYILSNGRFYVGRDKTNEFLRAKDHLQNALSVVDKTLNPNNPVIPAGKLTYDGFKLFENNIKPQHFEQEWGKLICSNIKTARQILLPFREQVNQNDYDKLAQTINFIIPQGRKMRKIVNDQGSISSFYKKESKNFFINQLSENYDYDDLVKAMRKAKRMEARTRTEKQLAYKQEVQDFAIEHKFVESPRAYKITMWSAVPITLWKKAPCFQLDTTIIERLRIAGCKYKKRDITTLYELLLVTNPTLFNNDEVDVIESLLTMQSYAINPLQMTNVNFGNKKINSTGVNIKFNDTIIGTKDSNADEVKVSVDLNQLAASLLKGMPLDKKDVRFTPEQLKEVRKLFNISYKGNNATPSNGTTQLWDTSNPDAVKAITKLVKKQQKNIQNIKKVEVENAIKVEQNKNLVVNLAEVLGQGDFAEGVKELQQMVTSSVNKFFKDAAGIDKIWKSFAKQKEMLRLTLSEIYYDSQVH